MELPTKEEKLFTTQRVKSNVPNLVPNSIVKDEAAEILQCDDNSIEENEDKLFKVPCHMCLQEIFQSELEVHILSCSYHIKQEEALIQNACYECNKTFEHKVTLSKHMKNDHGISKHKCGICQKEFPTLSRFQKHIILHKDQSNKPFNCEICKKSFYLEQYLKKHKNGVHGLSGESFMCNVCSKLFKEENNLQRHVAHFHSTEELLK